MTSKKQSWGVYYGYPSCCIRSFHTLLQTDTKWKDISTQQKQVTTNGFVPCQACAERILRGEVSIEDLILPSRQCNVPFRKASS